MKKEIKLIIQGYNEEKNIIVQKLGMLKSCNANIGPIRNLKNRLREIDKQIDKVLTLNNKLK